MVKSCFSCKYEATRIGRVVRGIAPLRCTAKRSHTSPRDFFEKYFFISRRWRMRRRAIFEKVHTREMTRDLFFQSNYVEMRREIDVKSFEHARVVENEPGRKKEARGTIDALSPFENVRLDAVNVSRRSQYPGYTGIQILPPARVRYLSVDRNSGTR